MEVMARLAMFGAIAAEPVRPWLTLFGLAAALVGAAQLWNVEDPRRGITYLVIAESGLALLAGLWGGADAAAALTAQSLALVLGGALVFLSNGYDAQHPWAAALPVLGAAVMLGAPLTVGFVGLHGLYSGLTSAWVVLVGVVLAQMILTGGLLKAAFEPGQPLGGEPLMSVAYLTGLVLLVIFSIVTGWLTTRGALGPASGALSPDVVGFFRQPNWVTPAMVLITAAAGFALWRFETAVRARADVAGAALTSLFRLDWLYRLVWGVIHMLSTGIFNLAEVLEGEGAILWTLVAVLLVWLVFK
ncbi:MAG: hypothetical protein HY784_02895 [Chloroflexi bacterium]|nr:hypothetical protein [Chloroflexota bacterium]